MAEERKELMERGRLEGAEREKQRGRDINEVKEGEGEWAGGKDGDLGETMGREGREVKMN